MDPRMDRGWTDRRLACWAGYEGRGYGVLVDIILGILEALWRLGLRLLGIWPDGGMIGALLWHLLAQ